MTFKTAKVRRRRAKSLQQIWRDHLLAGSLVLGADAGYSDGFFAILYPHGNLHCQRAADAYRACLRSSETFATWTLEEMVTALRTTGGGAWVRQVEDRYLSFGRLPP